MQAMLCSARFAEADAGIEHNAVGPNAGAGGEIERALKERGHLGNDVDGWIGAYPDCA